MKKRKKRKILSFIIPVIFLMIISLLDMYGASFISSMYKSALLKQSLWFIVSILVFIIIYKIDIKFFIKYANIFYYIGVISLILVLIIGSNVNGASSWFRIGPFSIQPSEIFKFFFLIYISTLASDKNANFLVFLKVLLATFIPCTLIFLEPDTGVVVIYLLIMVGVMLSSNIKKRYLIMTFIIGLIGIGAFFITYYLKKDLLIDIFGTSIFYRIDRLLSFKNNSSYQLNNAIIGLGASGLFGFGLHHPKIYVPEVITDFVFDLSIFNFGFIIGIVLVLIYSILLLKIYREIDKTDKTIYKCILSGVFGMMSFQVIEHICMNLGITPITGITLPFLSYGGSSMLSYFMILSLILKISTK